MIVLYIVLLLSTRIGVMNQGSNDRPVAVPSFFLSCILCLSFMYPVSQGHPNKVSPFVLLVSMIFLGRVVHCYRMVGPPKDDKTPPRPAAAIPPEDSWGVEKTFQNLKVSSAAAETTAVPSGLFSIFKTRAE